MNTNELRKLANRAIQECMYSDFYAAASPAQVITLLDEIDRLRTESVAADIRISNDARTIAELTAERDDAHKDLGNLLAIIHRDGGHYAEEHGKSEAYDQAVAVCASYRQAVDAAIAALKEALK